MHELLKQAQDAAKKGTVKKHDMEGGGNFEYTPPPAGICYGRLISYVELGMHPQKAFMGAEKPPAVDVELTFELFGKKHVNEYTDSEGKTHKRNNTITVRLAKKAGSRAGYTKLLKAMDYGRGNEIMALMVGEAFKLVIVHNEGEKDGKKVTYANLKDDSGWKISAPMREAEVDGEIEEVPVKVPEPTQPIRMLLWESPTIEMWNSIFIDGTYTRKEGDNEVEVSRNKLQQKCMDALDWDGSMMQQVLAEEDGDLPDFSGSADSGQSGDESDEFDLDDQEDQNEDDGSESADLDDDPLAGLDLDDEIPF